MQTVGNLKISISADKETAAQTAAAGISEFLRQEKENVLLLVSGGSSLQILDHININSCGEHLTITVLDERFGVAREDNNFFQFTTTKFYDHAKRSGCHFVEFLRETKEDTADAFEVSLRAWRDENRQGKIIAIVGVGDDGHTG